MTPVQCLEKYIRRSHEAPTEAERKAYAKVVAILENANEHIWLLWRDACSDFWNSDYPPPGSAQEADVYQQIIEDLGI